MLPSFQTRFLKSNQAQAKIDQARGNHVEAQIDKYSSDD